MAEMAENSMEDIALTLDNGAILDFRGRMFSEASWYDEDSGVLTHQKLYITDQHEQVYSVVAGSGNTRSRRGYRIAVQGESCTVHNGRSEMTMPFDMLMLAVRSLCGLEEGATPSLELVEETLRAANC